MKLSEIYTSIQCEGPNVGQPIQFVRFAGCNMRCPGWPCDTLYAVDPKNRADWEDISIGALPDRIKEWPRRICLTGGEPTMQPGLEDFGWWLIQAGYRIDLFTNGSFDWPSWAANPLVTIVMDWKLGGSGEAQKLRTMRTDNAQRLLPKDAIKFVCVDHDDLEEAAGVSQWLAKHVPKFVAAAWGRLGEAEVVDFVVDRELNWRLNVQMHKMIWPEAKRGV